MIDIIIPTYKPIKKLKNFLSKLAESISDNYNIITTCFPVSAATNRNYGLNEATSDIVIMIDDDIKGFFPGWADKLLEPLEDKNVVMSSARLMHSKTKTGLMMSIIPDLSGKYQTETIEYGSPLKNIIPIRLLPSACVAFRRNDFRFDEAYLGAGYEDTDACMQLNEKYPNGVYVINNEVKIIHRNEMKQQLNGQLEHNKRYFHWKWGLC